MIRRGARPPCFAVFQQLVRQGEFPAGFLQVPHDLGDAHRKGLGPLRILHEEPSLCLDFRHTQYDIYKVAQFAKNKIIRYEVFQKIFFNGWYTGGKEV